MRFVVSNVINLVHFVDTFLLHTQKYLDLQCNIDLLNSIAIEK